ncbi:hypothetical protein TNCV_3910281 [Trichonephila clavipes]|nr:hypothetical protein TNCV_3910281 [Trichonephila clavipes]
MACFVTGSSPVPLKTRRVGQRCTLNLSRAETSSRWCGVVVRRRGCQIRIPMCFSSIRNGNRGEQYANDNVQRCLHPCAELGETTISRMYHTGYDCIFPTINISPSPTTLKKSTSPPDIISPKSNLIHSSTFPLQNFPHRFYVPKLHPPFILLDFTTPLGTAEVTSERNLRYTPRGKRTKKESYKIKGGKKESFLLTHFEVKE